MSTEALFECLPAAAGDEVTIYFDGTPLSVRPDIALAAALLAGGVVEFRSTPISGAARAPYCMMGVCFECLVEIDGVPARQACLVPVRQGMSVRRQAGASQVVGCSDPETA